MKPLLMRHSEPINESFKIWRNYGPYRHNPWHYHPECEITYIFRGKGILFIGDQMLDYEENDIFLIGTNLPHEFRSNSVNKPDLNSESISIHFNKFFLGGHFYNLPETSLLVNFLNQAGRGIKIDDKAIKGKLKEAMSDLIQTSGMPKIYKLLYILYTISQSPHLIYLSSNSFVGSIDRDQDNRMNRIYEYVMKNYTNALSISEIAADVNMTETSFCRFFKERTHKSFVTYCNEIRVGYACRLLLEEKLSVSQVAFQSGFGNISNFNKQFKRVKRITPTQFLNKFAKKHSKLA